MGMLFGIWNGGRKYSADRKARRLGPHHVMDVIDRRRIGRGLPRAFEPRVFSLPQERLLAQQPGHDHDEARRRLGSAGFGLSLGKRGSGAALEPVPPARDDISFGLLGAHRNCVWALARRLEGSLDRNAGHRIHGGAGGSDDPLVGVANAREIHWIVFQNTSDTGTTARLRRLVAVHRW